VERAGLRLEAAWFAAVPTARHAAIQTAREALIQGNYEGTITDVDLVAVKGPGNPRLGWVPVDHPFAYAVQWTGGSAVGLVLVSARTGAAYS
jgi:hypothetical protein